MNVELARVDGWRALDTMFLRAVVRVCWRVGIDPSVLLAVMAIETGATFDPAKRHPNPRYTATGLIQFLESTARALGTTTARLARMTNVGQMSYVAQYFEKYGPKKARLVDMRPVDTYLVVFAPAFVGKPLPTVMFRKGSSSYEGNTGFDPPPRKGWIEVADVSRVLEAKLAAARGRRPLVVEVWPDGAGLALVVGSLAAAGAGGLALRARRRS